MPPRQTDSTTVSFRFKNGKENLTVKQYQTGKLQIQGSAGELYKMMLEGIVPLYNLHNPHARHYLLPGGIRLERGGYPEWHPVNYRRQRSKVGATVTV